MQSGYAVFGTSRGAPDPTGSARVLQWDGIDQAVLQGILVEHAPHEVYNLAALSSGSDMFDNPVAIAEHNGVAVVRMLEAIRAVDPAIRFLQASSSEIFGDAAPSPQSESTPRSPRSPYGAAKAFADAMVEIQRRRNGLFACSAILFNHESPRRPEAFVTRKITRAVALIRHGRIGELRLGNLDARRDWGFAGDYVRGMWMMLQQDQARDYVLATGATHSVRELCEVAFSHVGLDYRDYVHSDPAAYRTPEQAQLVGNADRARRELGWVPTMQFEEMMRMMVDADMAEIAASTQKGKA
jgi:GDPmannose 4,6-dehydratase